MSRNSELNCLEILQKNKIQVSSYVLTNKEIKKLLDLCELDEDLLNCVEHLLVLNKKDYLFQDVLDNIAECGYTEKSRNNRYTFVKHLGGGGFGDVFEVLDQNNERRVVKIYRESEYYPNSIYYRYNDADLKKEAKCLDIVQDWCGADTPCLVEVYKHKGKKRLVMDLISGKTLDHYMRRVVIEDRPELNYNQMIDFIKDFHDQDISHQDIKAENLIYDEEVKFIDWGLCCSTLNGGKCGAIGDPYVAPPEIMDLVSKKDYEKIENQSFDKMRSHDVWSLGIVLLDWYTTKPEDYYGNKYYKMGPEKLKNKINEIEDVEVRELVRGFLNKNWKSRLNFFDKLE